MELRQDVYLRAAEAIARSQNILTRLTDLNLSDQAVSADFGDDSAAIAKIQVVGRNETVQAVAAFQQELGSAYLEVILKRTPLIDRKNNIELLSNLIDKVQAEQDRAVNMMKQLNLEGNTDQRVWKVINDNFEFEKQKLDKYIQKRDELWKEQNREHVSFLDLCMSRFMEVSKLIPPAVFAARSELELPIDREAYLANFNENIERSMEIFQSFLKDASKMIDT